jgi:hypothetical protein
MMKKNKVAGLIHSCLVGRTITDVGFERYYGSDNFQMYEPYLVVDNCLKVMIAYELNVGQNVEVYKTVLADVFSGKEIGMVYADDDLLVLEMVGVDHSVPISDIRGDLAFEIRKVLFSSGLCLMPDLRVFPWWEDGDSSESEDEELEEDED